MHIIEYMIYIIEIYNYVTPSTSLYIFLSCIIHVFLSYVIEFIDGLYIVYYRILYYVARVI